MNTNKNATNSSYYQHTLKDSFTCVGPGLHTGLRIIMRVFPGEANTGIVFCRRDIDYSYSEIQAIWHNVTDTRLSTSIANSRGIRVSTIEHIMAALYACDIDNVRILVDGPEVPIMDGSAAPFVQLIKNAGKVRQDAERKAIIIKQVVSVFHDNKFASFQPSPIQWMELEIDFDSAPIGKQKISAPIQDKVFEDELAAARTFGFMEQVNTLHKLGLAQGGSLKNAVLIENNEVVNEEGLRFKDEFVRHKMVDSIGDIALIGARVIGRHHSIRSGHQLNHALIQKLMTNEHAWQYTTMRGAHRYWSEIADPHCNDTDKNDDQEFMSTPGFCIH